MASLVDTIEHGDKVTIIDRFGKKHTGKAVMKACSGGVKHWILNIGGAHGTPALADDRNIVRVAKASSIGKKITKKR